MGLPEKRKIRGGSLGSSAANLSHLPLLYRWEGQGNWCSSDPFFPLLLNKGADYTNKKLRLCLWQGSESDPKDICSAHATRALLPLKP